MLRQANQVSEMELDITLSHVHQGEQINKGCQR